MGGSKTISMENTVFFSIFLRDLRPIYGWTKTLKCNRLYTPQARYKNDIRGFKFVVTLIILQDTEKICSTLVSTSTYFMIIIWYLFLSSFVKAIHYKLEVPVGEQQNLMVIFGLLHVSVEGEQFPQLSPSDVCTDTAVLLYYLWA